MTGVILEVGRERAAAVTQRRRDVRPRVERGWVYAFLRAFTTVVTRDVCVEAVLDDIADGRPAVYVDFIGYDEVAHHSGPERVDALAVLRDIDGKVGRILRSLRWAPRPYHVVLLSDHGQTQGTPFQAAFGESLGDLVARLCGSAASGDPDAERGRTESSAWLRPAATVGDAEPVRARAAATVLASGNLGLVYLAASGPRVSLEEMEERHPGLVAGLVEHPGIGFVLVRSAHDGPVVIGARGRRFLRTGETAGEDPLAPFGDVAAKIATVDGYPSVADLMVNSAFDPETGEVHAFEHQVGSHGGLGGHQQVPFLLHPTALPEPPDVLRGPVALHRTFLGWRAHLGHAVRSAADAAV